MLPAHIRGPGRILRLDPTQGHAAGDFLDAAAEALAGETIRADFDLGADGHQIRVGLMGLALDAQASEVRDDERGVAAIDHLSRIDDP